MVLRKTIPFKLDENDLKKAKGTNVEDYLEELTQTFCGEKSLMYACKNNEQDGNDI